MDWSTLSPAEAFTALKNKPNIAGPWVEGRDPLQVPGTEFRWPPCRQSPDEQTIVWERNGLVEVHCWALLGKFPWVAQTFYTRKEADEFLVSCGWILCDELP